LQQFGTVQGYWQLNWVTGSANLMSILAVGINHHSAPVQVRERVSIAPEMTVGALHDLRETPGVLEAAILSTCNRTELYCRTDHGGVSQPAQWLSRFHQLGPEELDPFLYLHHNRDAVQHMLRVAAGLDSMVLGEPEILGQMKDAYRLARSAATIGAPLDRLFQHTFSVAKRVRTDTAIGESPVSVAFTAVTLARRLFGDLSRKSVLLVGAGETIELVARHLIEQDVEHVMVANRTVERARELADRFSGSALPLTALDDHLAKADIIISSTGATEPLITLNPIRRALKARKRRPIFIVDLAVPRDVEERVGELDDIYLYTVDDLREVADAGVDRRKAAAMEAETIVESLVDDYMAWLKSLDAVSAIRSMREQADHWQRQLLERAQRQLRSGHPVDQVMEQLAHGLTQKLLHSPSTRMREAAARGRDDLLHAAHELFDLPDDAAVRQNDDEPDTERS
jgi:glutamyl-tRNA reductase